MEKEISGMMIYYLFVCQRKLWYFYHQISMESENEDVQIGKIVDDTSYIREKKHINIDNIINIDYFQDSHILHEVKKSKSIEIAGIWQLKYYIYYLKGRGVENLSGRIDYPLLKKNVQVELAQEDESAIRQQVEKIKDIVSAGSPPKVESKSICKKCAYYDLCYI